MIPPTRFHPSTLRSTTLLAIGRRIQQHHELHSLSLSSFQNSNGSLRKHIGVVVRHHQRYTFTTTTSSTAIAATTTSITRQTVGPRSLREIFKELRKSPLQYATIPAIAACMAMYTNWIAVKMLFYPIEYIGTEWYREEFVPYGVSSTCIYCTRLYAIWNVIALKAHLVIYLLVFQRCNYDDDVTN